MEIFIPKVVVVEKLILFSGMLNDAVMLNPYSAGIDFSRQDLTTVDVRF